MAPHVVVAGIYTHCDLFGSFRVDDEYVVLVNIGSAPANLARWSFANRKHDQVDHYRYLFPRFLSNGDSWLLEPGGMVLLFTGRGTNGATATCGEAPQVHLFQHRLEQIWGDPGDTACLYDHRGRLVAAYEPQPVHGRV